MTSSLLNPLAETRSAAAMRKLQEAAWAAQRDHVRRASLFYRRKLGDTMRRAHTLDALADLPMTDKDELRQAQEAVPPFGDHLACDPARIRRVHRTSGTTGRALIIGFSEDDAMRIAEIGGRAFRAAGLGPGYRVVHCLNYCMWAGGVTDHLSLERAGAAVVPWGVGASEALVEMIPRLGINAISCTPSYPAHLEKLLRERDSAAAPRDLGLKLGLFGGEAGLDSPEFRARIENTWGLTARNANYGLSEMVSLFAGQCEKTWDLHFHAGELVFPEIVDVATGERLPLAEGTSGELVCTHLARECQPLIRYRTRDLITITATDPCPCGRTAWRFRVTGRSDDMFNVRGVNVFPTAIQRILAEFPALTVGEFRILLRGPGPYDRIELRVEAAAGLAAADHPAAAERLAEELRRRIGASAGVTLVPNESLPRSEGKTKWIERLPE